MYFKSKGPFSLLKTYVVVYQTNISLVVSERDKARLSDKLILIGFNQDSPPYCIHPRSDS